MLMSQFWVSKSKIRARIRRGPVYNDFKVQMITETVACIAHISQQLSCLNYISFIDDHLALVTVLGLHSVTVIDRNISAETFHILKIIRCVNHCPCCCCVDRSSFRGSQVDPCM